MAGDLSNFPLPEVNDDTWEDWAGAVHNDVLALYSTFALVVVQDTEPSSEMFNGPIPVGTVWIKP